MKNETLDRANKKRAALTAYLGQLIHGVHKLAQKENSAYQTLPDDYVQEVIEEFLEKYDNKVSLIYV